MPNWEYITSKEILQVAETVIQEVRGSAEVIGDVRVHLYRGIDGSSVFLMLSSFEAYLVDKALYGLKVAESNYPMYVDSRLLRKS